MLDQKKPSLILWVYPMLCTLCNMPLSSRKASEQCPSINLVSSIILYIDVFGLWVLSKISWIRKIVLTWTPRSKPTERSLIKPNNKIRHCPTRLTFSNYGKMFQLWIIPLKKLLVALNTYPWSNQANPLLDNNWVRWNLVKRMGEQLLSSLRRC